MKWKKKLNKLKREERSDTYLTQFLQIVMECRKSEEQIKTGATVLAGSSCFLSVLWTSYTPQQSADTSRNFKHVLTVDESNSFFLDKYNENHNLSIKHRLHSITYMMDSTDFGLMKMAMGKSCATCNRLIAFPLTSSIQCLPWKQQYSNWTLMFQRTVIHKRQIPWLYRNL